MPGEKGGGGRPLGRERLTISATDLVREALVGDGVAAAHPREDRSTVLIPAACSSVWTARTAQSFPRGRNWSSGLAVRTLQLAVSASRRRTRGPRFGFYGPRQARAPIHDRCTERSAFQGP